MSFGLSNCNVSCIECLVYGALVVHCNLWMAGISWLISCPLSMVVINLLDDLRNTKGRPMSNVNSRIPFSSHLKRCDGAARTVAMFTFWLAGRGHVPEWGVWFSRVSVFRKPLKAFPFFFLPHFYFLLHFYISSFLWAHADLLSSSQTLFFFFFCWISFSFSSFWCVSTMKLGVFVPLFISFLLA